jgi:hypothetical protein
LLKPIRSALDESPEKRAISLALTQASARSAHFDPIKLALRCVLDGPTPEERIAWKAIENLRQALSKRTDLISITDFGAGAPNQLNSPAERRTGVRENVPAGDLVKWSTAPPWTQFLFYLVRTLKPASILEMGTCAGLSGSYLAAALALNGKGHLWTLEGCPETAKIAQKHFSTLGQMRGM